MYKKLSDIALIIMGQSPKSIYYNQEKRGLPFLQGRKTFGTMYPYFDTWTEKWNKEAVENDVLFTVRAPVGDINITKNRIAIGRGIAAIRATNCHPKYLYYLLESNRNKFLSTSTGTIFDSINVKQLESITLLVHSHKIQNHIVDTIAHHLMLLSIFL